MPGSSQLFYPRCVHLSLRALDRTSSVKAIVTSSCPVGREFSLADQKRYLATVISLLAWREALRNVAVAAKVLEAKEVTKTVAALWTKYVEGSGNIKSKTDDHAFRGNHAAIELLVILLVQEMLCSPTKRIASSPSWPPSKALAGHRARLAAELTRLQIRQGKQKPEELRADWQPMTDEQRFWARGRWVRINTRRTSQAKVLEWLRLHDFEVHEGNWLAESAARERRFILPPSSSHPQHLLLLPSWVTTELVASSLYRQGEVVLQDAASCWPAQLLLTPLLKQNEQHQSQIPHLHVLDATAAPGNKTSHLSALLSSLASSASSNVKITALERDPKRFETLCRQLDRFGCLITSKPERTAQLPGQVRPLLADFIGLDPSLPTSNADAKGLADVTHLLLDPSCSGSGIVNRLDWLTKDKSNDEHRSGSGRHMEEEDATEQTDEGSETERLDRLAVMQVKMLGHAFRSLPALQRLVYSTCSIHRVENEQVVLKALSLPEAVGWRMASPSECFPDWPWRGEGEEEECKSMLRAYPDSRIDATSVKRGQGQLSHINRTNGFFAACLVKDYQPSALAPSSDPSKKRGGPADGSPKRQEESSIDPQPKTFAAPATRGTKRRKVRDRGQAKKRN